MRVGCVLPQHQHRDKISAKRNMIPGEHDKIYRCERCDRETAHVVESIGSDNRLHYLCWDCVGRQEKRFNQKPGWRRAHRTRRYEQIAPSPAPLPEPEKPKVT
jgi:hypothetical protein